MRKGDFRKNHPFPYNEEVLAGVAIKDGRTFLQLISYNRLFPEVNTPNYNIQYV